ncbi:hypothetical protein VTN77DRAFT_3151 [Rasamsonia byssochlamydoides]|uniref:uncharacterized protein n=1 Tax=Rasamsonia byssochlamydoides TaxID=89139 RepID=UPI003742E6BC
MASNERYTYFRVPKDENIAESAQKYKELRLQALKLSPTSFSSTYKLEAAFTDPDWVSRLARDGIETFVCAAHDQSHGSNQNQVNWVAQVTLRGPLSAEDFILPPASGHPTPRLDAEEERWQMLSLFVLPSHRGKGIGKALCREALRYLTSYQPHPTQVRVRLMIKPENHVVVNMYRQLGFAEAGRCTLAEALIANGDRELLPEGYSGDSKYTARSGLIMMVDLSRSDAATAS